MLHWKIFFNLINKNEINVSKIIQNIESKLCKFNNEDGKYENESKSNPL